MKIYSISTIKNESDIIESFIRYNYTYLDGMVIIDHDSKDNSKKIIENLQKEGFNIKYVKLEKLSHDQGEAINNNIDKQGV